MGKSWENHGKIMGTCGKPLLLHGFYGDLNNKSGGHGDIMRGKKGDISWNIVRFAGFIHSNIC